ncbi:hypothetical protein JW905_12770 [bacterium]|nr:hypothetical protein [candidate division CSSED10-310 bacterium]
MEERDRLNNKLQQAIYNALYASSEIREIVDELSERGYQATLGILIGTILQRSLDADFEELESDLDFSEDDLHFLRNLKIRIE